MATGVNAILRPASIRRIAESVNVLRVSKGADAQLRVAFSAFVSNIISSSLLFMRQDHSRVSLMVRDIMEALSPHQQEYAQKFVFSVAPCRAGIRTTECPDPSHAGHETEHGICNRGCTEDHGQDDEDHQAIHHFFPFSSFKAFVKIVLYATYSNTFGIAAGRPRVRQDALELLYVVTQYYLQIVVRRAKILSRMGAKRTVSGEHIKAAADICANEGMSLLTTPLSDEQGYTAYERPDDPYSNMKIYGKADTLFSQKNIVQFPKDNESGEDSTEDSVEDSAEGSTEDSTDEDSGDDSNE